MKEILFDWNPWWAESYTFQKVKRELFQRIKPWIERKEIIALLGVRRSGKTTELFEIIDHLIHEQHINRDNICFIKADDDRVEKKELIQKALDEYITWKNPKGRIFLFIDEIQEIPEWQKTLKRIYDLEQENKKIFISGSNASLLKEELSYLLTGRFAYFELYPFSFKEFLLAHNIKIQNEMDLIQQKNTIRNLLLAYIEYGGFPEITLERDKEKKEELLRFYFESILYRDVVKRKNIRNVEKLDRLVRWHLQNTSAYANYEKLGKYCELSTDTTGEYTRYLEDAYLIFVVNIFAYSLKKQFVNPKKVYCIDPGIRKIVGFIFSQDSGKMYENIVFIHLRRTGKQIFYWSEKHECDFIIQNKMNIEEVIQVSSDLQENKEREVNGLLEAMKHLNVLKGSIITKDYESKEIIDEKEIRFIPLWKWLLLR
ncbi:MAG: ATP-binding protein [Candidatus Thermoplasmatota archaeon]